MKPTIYIHHDDYTLNGPHITSVNQQHMKEGYPQSLLGYYTFYQYFIERNGKTIHCRPDMDATVAYKKDHENSISVCLAGNFNRQEPHGAQLLALNQLFTQFRERYGITALDIKEHRSYQATSCPGDKIPKNYFAYLFINHQLGLIQSLIYKLLLDVKSGIM